ncbi:hypothetical protein LPC27_09570 [Paraclostridium bifermentans]|uniref:hypothetical protein n=1 Tax=Paraclostridium bifermentans TaxID=1490 RepID=UPI001F18767F|nr:hypothetical protein [Paraclostridium bifermentans]MCE9676015.1 hypothetical protein [Paraclostridium bifermentans]
MIHTIQLYTIISFDEKDKIEKRFNKSIIQVMDEVSENTEGITISGRGKIADYYINMHIDVTEILDKGDVNEVDYYIVQKEIDRVIEYIVGYKLELTLLRIEYRIDIRVESSAERYILFHIYKKMIRKFGFKKRKDKKEYETSVMYDSGSIQLIIYDKDTERLAKEEISKYYEKNMLRFEVKVLNNHLNYNKNKYNIPKTLQNYFREDMKNNYMIKNIQKVVYKGDYYSIYRAGNIIEKSNLKDRDKKLVRDFLIDVSKLGITGAKSIKKKDKSLKYTDYKYKKAIELLEELNINPILIPKNLKAPNGESYSYIKNPFNL